jgi:4-amino-4-deoxy-L-arabinose transferase-like glycosyltransferase
MFNNGPAGLFRLFDGELGGQASWLLPLALVALVVTASRRVRFPLDRRQQAVLLWGTWLLTVGAFFSVAGFFHSYYLVTLAPAVAALAAIAIVTLARDYLAPDRAWRAWALPAALVVTAAGQAFVLSNFPSWSRWITPALAAITVVAVVALVVMRLRRKLEPHNSRWAHANDSARLLKGSLAAGLLALLIAPTAWTIDTVSASNGGQIPSAGPSPTFAGSNFRGAFPGGAPGFANGGAPGAGGPFAPGGSTTGTPPQAPGQGAFGGFGNGSGGGFGGGTGGALGSTAPVTGTVGARGGFRAGAGFRGGFGGAGGGGGDASVDKQLLQYLKQHQGSTRYLFAVSNSMSAAPYIIQTGKPVMSLGGFSGSDPILTTAQLKALIENNTVRYFLLGGGGGGPDGSSLTSWVQQSCTAVPATAWQTTATSGSTGSTTSGGFMRQELYDCGNLAGAAN